MKTGNKILLIAGAAGLALIVLGLAVIKLGLALLTP